MILLMCSRKSAFSSLARIEGFVVMPDGKPRSSASSISSRFAESTKIFMISTSAPGPSFRDGPVVVSAVARHCEQSAPAGRIEVGPRGELPALELLSLRVVEPGIHLHVAMPATDPLDLGQRPPALGPFQVVDGVDRHHQIEDAVRERK